MKKVTRIKASVLSLALAASLVLPGGVDLSAAKAPAFAKKSAKVKEGSTITLNLKNVNKKAKVKWASKATKIAKIVKASKASAKVKGIKAGKAKITAKYTLGKYKKNLSIQVKVTAKDNKIDTVQPTEVPAGTAVPAASTAPTTAPAGTNPTADPNAVKPTEAATPTPEVTVGPDKWVTTWGTSEEKNDVSADSAMPKIPLADSTIRQIIRITTSGSKIKFRLSNQYGSSDVVVKSMHIAKQIEPDKSTIDPSTDTVITVGGEEEFKIPARELIETDGINFDAKALDNIAISMYFESAPTNNITGHRGARATTYQIAGNHVSDETITTEHKPTSWFFLADCSLMSPGDSRAVVCFGDSITDGYGTDASYLGKKPDSYTRWGDYFAKRLQANEKTKHVSVINEGIGANAMFGSYPTDAGKDRFERDLTQHDGVEYCIILFGVNDLNKLDNTSKYDQLLPEYKKMVETCHDNGIKVYGAPILPFGTSDYYSDASEEVRTKINTWMRNLEESEMDGIIDFESALADPDNPKNIKHEYTLNDGLHPYEGYDVMANAIDLTMFEK